MKNHEPLSAQADLFEQSADVVEALLAAPIAFEVVAVAFLATDDPDRVRTILKCLEEVLGLQTPRARNSHLTDRKRPGKVRRGRSVAKPRARNEPWPGAVFTDERDHDAPFTRIVIRATIAVAEQSSSSCGITHRQHPFQADDRDIPKKTLKASGCPEHMPGIYAGIASPSMSSRKHGVKNRQARYPKWLPIVYYGEAVATSSISRINEI
jgi:hypothetical protein